MIAQQLQKLLIISTDVSMSILLVFDFKEVKYFHIYFGQNNYRSKLRKWQPFLHCF